MQLLNAGCGSNRHGPPWVNLDCLRAHLAPGTPERENLDAEPNYVEHTMGSGPLPFPDNSFDGCLYSHVIEHMDAIEAVAALKDCHRILKPGGVVLVSVPDASYFRRVYAEDTVENAQRLFGEPIHLPDGETTFFGYGLFNRFHKAVLTEDALWAYLVRAGFGKVTNLKWDKETNSHVVPFSFEETRDDPSGAVAFDKMVMLLNRRQFSLEMVGVKL